MDVQQYYNDNKCATRVKAAGLLNAGEAKQLAGVDSMTIAPDLIRLLAQTEEPEAEVVKYSIFEKRTKAQETRAKSFVNDELKYREEFAKSYEGKGAWKTKEVCLRIYDNVGPVSLLTWTLKAIDVFCEYQVKAEGLLRDTITTAT